MTSRSFALPAWLGTTLLACAATLVLLADPQPALAASGWRLGAVHPQPVDALAAGDEPQPVWPQLPAGLVRGSGMLTAPMQPALRT
jgi:hypothetical protein